MNTSFPHKLLLYWFLSKFIYLLRKEINLDSQPFLDLKLILLEKLLFFFFLVLVSTQKQLSFYTILMSIVKYFTVIEFVAETYRRKTLRGNCAMREIGPT